MPVAIWNGVDNKMMSFFVGRYTLCTKITSDIGIASLPKGKAGPIRDMYVHIQGFFHKEELHIHTYIQHTGSCSSGVLPSLVPFEKRKCLLVCQ